MELEIKLIRTDGGTQARAKLNPDTVDDYRDVMRDSDSTWPFPPVVVFHDGSVYWLADGFHRIAAARQHGRFVCEADVRQGTQRDAVLHAAGANADHGLRRTNEDKRRAVLRLLEDAEWGQWSDREIARRCKVSPTFVGFLRRDVADTVHVDSIGERKFTHPKTGETAVMKTGNIGGNGGDPDAWNPDNEDMRRGLRASLAMYGGSAERWELAKITGLSNDELRMAISREYGLGGSSSGPGRAPISYKGGADPKFFFGRSSWYGERATLRGAALLNAARDVLGIPYPEERPEIAPETTVSPAPIVESYNGTDYRRETITNEHGQTETRWQPIQEAPAPDPVFALLKQAERALGEAIIKFNVDTHFHALGKVNSVYSALLAAIRVYEYGSEV